MKATEQYFPVVLFIMLYKVVLTFESVDEILKCDHSNKKLLSSTFPSWCLLCCTMQVTGAVNILFAPYNNLFPLILYRLLSKTSCGLPSKKKKKKKSFIQLGFIRKQNKTNICTNPNYLVTNKTKKNNLISVKTFYNNLLCDM